jgi:hypothetical protein
LADEITVPIYDKRNKYRLYYDRQHFEIQEKESGKWVSSKTDPDVLIEQIDSKPKSISDFARVLNSIRPEYMKAASKYIFRRNALLSIMHRAPGILDIIRDAPGIAVLLADSFGKGDFDIRNASRLVYEPRKDIVKSVGGQGTKSEVKMLSSIKGSSINTDSLKKVRRLLEDESLKATERKLKINSIDEDLLNSIIDEQSYFDYRAFSKHVEYFYGYNHTATYTKDDWMFDKSRIKREINQLKRIIENQPNVDIYLENIQHCKSLLDLQEYKISLERKKDFRPLNKCFPEPPINETENIRAIKSLEELALEGKEMNNCVFNYSDWIIHNRYFVYKVLKPERATLGISIEVERYFSIDQLKLKSNKIASEETWEAVKSWFEANCSYSCN